MWKFFIRINEFNSLFVFNYHLFNWAGNFCIVDIEIIA